MRRRYLLVTGVGLFLLFAVLLGSIAWFSQKHGHKTSVFFREKVGVVVVKGIITDAQPTIDDLVKFAKDPSVKAIVLRVESPGGGVSPSQELYQEIRRIGKDKPVVASMGSVAASGGYYISAAAQKVFANPGSITGSIGVIMQFANFEELFKKIGFQLEVVKSGAYKDVGNPARKMTPRERAYLQKVIDNVQQQFVRDVAQGRHLPEEKVSVLADGRIFTGEQARELGLVDELGSLRDAIDAAAAMAGIRGEPKVVYPEKKRLSLLSRLFNKTSTPLSERLRQYLGVLLVYPLSYTPSLLAN
ncbi:MAG: signal peptide peptidase SppA [Deltaproteobacteria bacterium]|nr:signal peptide peptidase SppA [Deltaproteobacteria bacterium]MBW2069880.1 signal peptide peptidase SppA [Deltaproteobacteria bacterium]